MPFSPKIKSEVRKKAHYRCCLCSGQPVEVHHIKPENEGGSNTIDNAAPLCANCHADYGNNPDKRKEIRERRDFWYEQCAKGLSEKFIGMRGSEERIHNFVNRACDLYHSGKMGKSKLAILIPAGINELINDEEIEKALEQIGNRLSGHPLRAWKERIKKIGYKKIFAEASKSGFGLDKNSIERLLIKFET